MSLKAKIEAVIYASEEPVTLQQLIGVLGQEAQAELERASAGQQTLPLEQMPFDEETLVEEEAFGEAQSAIVSNELRNTLGMTEPPLADGDLLHTREQSVDEKALAREERARTQRLREYFRGLLAQLIDEYATPERGLEIREVASGYRFATKPEYHDAVRGFVRSLKPPLKLSFPALETLAVVAYKQPVTAPEVSEIRGVDSGGVLGSLMARKLVTAAGRKQVIGRPILYKTTKEFLLRFGLKDIAELPSIEEFEKMASELADAEPLQEEIGMTEPMSVTGANLEEEKQAVEPQADGDSSELESVPVDGRISGPPLIYDQPYADDEESPAHDAEVEESLQAEEGSR